MVGDFLGLNCPFVVPGTCRDLPTTWLRSVSAGATISSNHESSAGLLRAHQFSRNCSHEPKIAGNDIEQLYLRSETNQCSPNVSSFYFKGHREYRYSAT